MIDELWFIDVDREVARERLVKRHVLTGVASDRFDRVFGESTFSSRGYAGKILARPNSVVFVIERLSPAGIDINGEWIETLGYRSNSVYDPRIKT